jgi:hypothetical protein
MMELKVILDFACYSCQGAVGVTVKCAGKGLATAGRTVAAVHVSCPTCGAVNHLLFEPSGTVRDVRPCGGAISRPVPTPSVN